MTNISKTILAAVCVIAAGAAQAQLSMPRSHQEMLTTAKLGLSEVSKSQFEAANRKGSHRVGGTNSKGKKSKYRGGRK